jgi:hypothetical protein
MSCVINILDSARTLDPLQKMSILEAFLNPYRYVVDYAGGWLCQVCPFSIRQVAFRIFGGLLMLTETDEDKIAIVK